MSKKDLAPEERAVRGRRLLIFGMFSVVVVTIVALFLTLYIMLAPLDATGTAVKATLIVSGIAIVACVIIWFLYSKLILKD